MEKSGEEDEAEWQSTMDGENSSEVGEGVGGRELQKLSIDTRRRGAEEAPRGFPGSSFALPKKGMRW